MLPAESSSLRGTQSSPRHPWLSFSLLVSMPLSVCWPGTEKRSVKQATQPSLMENVRREGCLQCFSSSALGKGPEKPIVKEAAMAG